jgi:hypothetical protein
MQDLGVVPKLLFVLKDETTPISTIKVTCEVLTVLLNHGTNKGYIQNILRSVPFASYFLFGLFLFTFFKTKTELIYLYWIKRLPVKHIVKLMSIFTVFELQQSHI